MKVRYDGFIFDSELEVDYYKYLKELEENGKIQQIIYHPIVPIQITKNNYYTPDFIIHYFGADGFTPERCEIVETKGYNPYSKMRDDMIHQVMLSKTENELKKWLADNETANFGEKVIYKKIKYLKAYGFVDWDFKNPNTIANKRKEKITELNSELKELRQFKKDTIRYFSLHNKAKLTPNQKEFIAKYLNQFYKN